MAIELHVPPKGRATLQSVVQSLETSFEELFTLYIARFRAHVRDNNKVASLRVTSRTFANLFPKLPEENVTGMYL